MENRGEAFKANKKYRGSTMHHYYRYDWIIRAQRERDLGNTELAELFQSIADGYKK